MIRLILVLALICSVSGQVVYTPVYIDSMAIDTTYISEEELFLKKISDEALAKEEKREKITNKILAIIIIYLLVDRIINK